MFFFSFLLSLSFYLLFDVYYLNGQLCFLFFIIVTTLYFSTFLNNYFPFFRSVVEFYIT